MTVTDLRDLLGKAWTLALLLAVVDPFQWLG